MPTLKYLDGTYECATAIKGSDYIHLLDESGVMIVAFDEIKDFSKFTLTNGSYTSPTSDHDCFLAVIRDDGTLGRGGHKCSDIPMTAADVGAFPIVDAQSADFDMTAIMSNVHEPALYKTDGTTLGTPFAKGDVSNLFKRAAIISYSWAKNYGFQIAFPNGLPYMLTRALTGGVWNNNPNDDGHWKKVYSESYKPTAADVNALALDGSNTMTGDVNINKVTPRVIMTNSSTGAVSRFLNASNATVMQSTAPNETVYRQLRLLDTKHTNAPAGNLNNVLQMYSNVPTGNGKTEGTVSFLHTGNLAANNIGQIVTGSYVGTGTFGEENPNTLTFDRPPKFLAICGTNGVAIFSDTSGNLLKYMGITDALTTEYQTNVWLQVQGSSGWGATGHAKCSEDRKAISWYVDGIDDTANGASAQCNTSGRTYRYFAIL